MTIDRERLYSIAPIGLQNVLCAIEGWRIRRDRYPPAFFTLLRDAESRAQWDEDQLRRFRDHRLAHYVQQCALHVPYYRTWFREQGVDPRDIRGVEDLRGLPILTKKDVQRSQHSFASEVVPRRRRVLVHTSGTTGGGLSFFSTREAIREQFAIWWRYRRWHGIELGTSCGYFGGRTIVPASQQGPPFWRYNPAGKQLLFSGYHMSERNLPAYVSIIRRTRPPWLHGYPSLLSLLASWIADRQLDIGYQVRWVTIGAEGLLPHQSRVIEEAFGVRPIQHYGMAEAVANISECARGRMHVDEDFAAVEFLENRAAGGFRVVGSSLSNAATGFLRYDVGDLVSGAGTGCSCGYPGRTIEGIDGRNEDYIVLSNGVRVSCGNQIFKMLGDVREAQIVQRTAGDVTVRVIRGPHYHEGSERRLVREMRKRVGSDTSIRVEYAQRLERSPNGKLRLVVSDVGKIPPG